MKAVSLAIIAVLLCSGCATMIHGTYDTITVNSLEKGTRIYVDDCQTGAPMTDDRASLGHKTLALSGLALVLALVLIPYVYVIVTAFKPAEEVYDATWLPQRISFEAWIEVFEVNRFHIYLWNSLVAGAGSDTSARTP